MGVLAVDFDELQQTSKHGKGQFCVLLAHRFAT